MIREFLLKYYCKTRKIFYSAENNKDETSSDHKMFFLYCLTHSNELVFKDASRKSSILFDSEIYEDVYVLRGSNPKRVRLLEEIQQKISDESALKLQTLSQTRWTTRLKAYAVIVKK